MKKFEHILEEEEVGTRDLLLTNNILDIGHMWTSP